MLNTLLIQVLNHNLEAQIDLDPNGMLGLDQVGS